MRPCLLSIWKKTAGVVNRSTPRPKKVTKEHATAMNSSRSDICIRRGGCRCDRANGTLLLCSVWQQNKIQSALSPEATAEECDPIGSTISDRKSFLLFSKNEITTLALKKSPHPQQELAGAFPELQTSSSRASCQHPTGELEFTHCAAKKHR